MMHKASALIALVGASTALIAGAQGGSAAGGGLGDPQRHAAQGERAVTVPAQVAHTAPPATARTGVGHGVRVGKVTITTRERNGTYELVDPTRGGLSTHDFFADDNKKPLSDRDNVWGDGTMKSRQSAAVDAHFAAEKTWDYFQNTFGRRGVHNDGKGPSMTVHYDRNRADAFADHNGASFGDGKDGKNPTTSVDVVAHEYTHAINQATARLASSGEGAGLNEATSDIFGTMVEFYANTPADAPDYLIGEKANFYGDGKPLRYMDKPSRDGKSPDYYKPGIGRPDNVHYAAGVANHFFYLLAEGSGKKVINGTAYNSPTHNGSKITGIGRSKAARIWYKALTTQFSSTTNYKSARAGTLKASAALYGKNSTEYRTVEQAWTAVNVKQ
ncbi:M4 family metallopeptidase [Streptomyces sp. NPDC058773]|uniref:M4 family metallopeptidase n=1 Tax=Streptomyces sp. NPDC058773 TaxID=3346632 RepID=UPI00369C4F9D